MSWRATTASLKTDQGKDLKNPRKLEANLNANHDRFLQLLDSLPLREKLLSRGSVTGVPNLGIKNRTASLELWYLEKESKWWKRQDGKKEGEGETLPMTAETTEVGEGTCRRESSREFYWKEKEKREFFASMIIFFHFHFFFFEKHIQDLSDSINT